MVNLLQIDIKNKIPRRYKNLVAQFRTTLSKYPQVKNQKKQSAMLYTKILLAHAALGNHVETFDGIRDGKFELDL